jgi:GNAT superfamily N-acetyltransferase
MDPVCAAMVLTDEPDDVVGVDVHRVQSLDEHLAGLEILLAAATWSDSAAADERARAEEVFDRRARRGGHQWLAWHGDQPVAYALAERTAAGLFLAGGATLPEARGHGCYRALVRARWDEAIRLGLPGLAVQAQYGSSAPILRRLGFIEVAQVHTLQS